MTSRTRVVVALPALLLCVAIGGCNTGQTTSRTSVGVGATPVAPDAQALRVDLVGGFTTPDMLATRLPVVVVYADGRALTPGPTTMIYPGPALPNVQEGSIPPSQLAELVREALALDEGDLGDPPVADAATTRLTVTDGGETRVVEAYALAEAAEPTAGVTAAQQESRTRLAGLVRRATDAASGAADRAYVPESLAAVAREYEPVEGEVSQPEQAWPGPALPGASLGEGLGLGCVVAEGDDARAVLAAARTANTETPWTSAGRQWRVGLRPLLPGEAGCGELFGPGR